MRRLRRTSVLRDLVRETRLDAGDLVLPLFVEEGLEGRSAIDAMPGVDRHSLATVVDEAGEALSLGIPAVLLFGIPAEKDEQGSGAWDDEGVVQLAVRALKAAHPDLLVITDVCLCEYTSHGHCGLLRADGSVANDESVELLARTAVSHARAGADIVAPSDMMDGRVGALRAALDEDGFDDTPILAYSAKFASRLLRPVPRRGRLHAGLRRPPRLPDGSGQRRRGAARDPARHPGGRRHGDGQAGAALPGHHPARSR